MPGIDKTMAIQVSPFHHEGALQIDISVAEPIYFHSSFHKYTINHVQLNLQFQADPRLDSHIGLIYQHWMQEQIRAIGLCHTPIENCLPFQREFVGMIADDPHQKIKLKNFHCEIVNDAERLKEEEMSYKKIPVFQEVGQREVMDNYFQIKQDVKGIIETEVARLKREWREAKIEKEKRENHNDS